MTRIAHLADLHFGSVPDGLAEALRDDLLSVAPSAVVIAGDLTMAASRREFAAAEVWLASLPAAKIVVPGNHDLQRWNVRDRFLRPYDRFDAAAGPHRRAELDLGDCTILALDTTARWQPHFRWQEGRVRRRDALALDLRLRAADPRKLKVVVAHHPFAPVAGMPRARPVRWALNALDIFAKRGVALVLSGHTHQSYVVPVAHGRGRVLAVGAPTALSNRRRGEENGYWVIDVDGRRVELTLRLREGATFMDKARHAFEIGDHDPS